MEEGGPILQFKIQSAFTGLNSWVIKKALRYALDCKRYIFLWLLKLTDNATQSALFCRSFISPSHYWSCLPLRGFPPPFFYCYFLCQAAAAALWRSQVLYVDSPEESAEVQEGHPWRAHKPINPERHCSSIALDKHFRGRQQSLLQALLARNPTAALGAYQWKYPLLSLGAAIC